MWIEEEIEYAINELNDFFVLGVDFKIILTCYHCLKDEELFLDKGFPSHWHIYEEHEEAFSSPVVACHECAKNHINFMGDSA